MSAASITGSPVKLAEIFPMEAILMGLEHRSKAQVLADLVRHAVALGHLPRTAEDSLIQSLQDREELGTTALGNRIAFPHCQSSFADRFVGVAAFLDSGVTFDAVDAEPVDTVFMILGPFDDRERFLEILGRLVVIGRDRRLGVLLRGCRTAEHVSSFLKELDEASLSAPRGSERHQRPLKRTIPAPGSASGSPG